MGFAYILLGSTGKQVVTPTWRTVRHSGTLHALSDSVCRKDGVSLGRKSPSGIQQGTATLRFCQCLVK
jgi:hypothetical protein